jgi:hypothetical protein
MRGAGFMSGKCVLVAIDDPSGIFKHVAEKLEGTLQWSSLIPLEIDR